MSERQAEMAPDRKAAWNYINKREADHREALQQMIEREVERRYSEEWSREGTAFLAGWRACADTLAPPAPPLALSTQPLTETHGWPQTPAPPVATTGAVPVEVREAIHRLTDHADPDKMSTPYCDGYESRVDCRTVRRWLSAAPAPKASEGGWKCAKCGEPVSDAVAEAKVSHVCPAQPHARAEGANAEVRAAWDRIGLDLEHDADCDLMADDGSCDCQRSHDAETLRNALFSGSAEGR